MCMSHGSYSKEDNYNLLYQNLEIGESGAEFTIQHVDLKNQNIGNVNENNEIYYYINVKESPKDIYKYRRWIVLVLVCLIGMGMYCIYIYIYIIHSQFGYMNGNVIEKQLIQDIGTTQKGYDILISIYSWPNIILPFFGGYFIDKFGTKVMLILFLIIMLIGQMFYNLAISFSRYWLQFLEGLYWGYVVLAYLLLLMPLLPIGLKIITYQLPLPLFEYLYLLLVYLLII